MSDILFSGAKDAAELGAEIIADEDEFARLREYLVIYVYRDKAAKKLGKTTYGTAEVVRGKNALLWWQGQGQEDSTPFFRITLAEDIWENLDEDQRKWLLRHELRHCGLKFTKKGPKLTLKPHDFELFSADLKDPVMQSVCQVIKVVREGQPTLFDKEADGRSEVPTITFDSVESATQTMKEVARRLGADKK